jgi:hypothetical protein
LTYQALDSFINLIGARALLGLKLVSKGRPRLS